MDYLKDIKALIAILPSEGFAPLALQLRDEMAAAATGTELIMGVRFFLKKASLDGLSESTTARIKCILDELDNLLSANPNRR